MDLRYIYGGVSHSVESVMAFTGEGQSAFWSSPFFHFFPEIDQEEFLAMDRARRVQRLEEALTAFERSNEALLQEKVNAYNDHWRANRAQIVEALQEIFALDLSGLFNDLTGQISMNPVCPRHLAEHTFDVFYLNSQYGALGLSLHEIIHFVWFHVWQKVFRDSPEEYESPSLKWILSEMVVEPVMRDARLAELNPYYQDGSCVYPYFYTLKLEGRPILDILYDMLRGMSMEAFMRESYGLVQKHEAEIRRHIEESEQA